MKKNLNIAYLNGAEGIHRRFLYQSNAPSEPVAPYGFVDLGLPSGTLWAATNVGATKPEEFGLYFAWGETEGYEGITDKKQFTWADYKLCGGSKSTLTKYNNKSSYGTVDNKLVLEQVDDAAYVSDNTCRMPTKAELEELKANTTSTWETLNGVNGRRFTSNINSNSIFVPAAGYCDNGSVYDVGSYGSLWSSSLYESGSRNAWYLYFNSGNVGMSNAYRDDGFSVRAVKIPESSDDSGNGSSDDQNGPLYYKFVENQYLESELSSGNYPNVFAECRHTGVLGPLWGTPQWLQSFLGPQFTQPVWADAFVFMPCDYLSSNKEYHMFKTYEELREMVYDLPEAIRITKEEYYEGRNVE